MKRDYQLLMLLLRIGQPLTKYLNNIQCLWFYLPKSEFAVSRNFREVTQRVKQRTGACNQKAIFSFKGLMSFLIITTKTIFIIFLIPFRDLGQKFLRGYSS